MTHYATGLMLRDKDGNALPDRNATTTVYGEMFVDDNTGWVAAGADPTNEVVDGSPVTVARLRGVTADAAERAATTNGRLVIEVPGDYEIRGVGNVLSTGAADTVHLEVFVNGAVVADAAATPGGEISCDVCAVGTAAQSWALHGILPDMKVGDYVDLRVTATGTNTPAIRRARWGVKLIADNANPGKAQT